MKVNFEEGKTYLVYGSPEGERKVITTAVCLGNSEKTGKVKFQMTPTTDLQTVFPSKRKDPKRNKSFNVINTIKDGIEQQFCQYYVTETDRWITLSSINNVEE